MISFRPTSTTRKRIRDIENAEHFFNRGLKNALFDIGKDAALRAGDLINNEGRTGRIYLIDDTPHTASAPGEAPANRTGKLKKSMNFLVHGVEEVEWGSESSYARYLEEGTGKMQPRTFLGKVAEREGGNHASYLEQRVDDAIKRRG